MCTCLCEVIATMRRRHCIAGLGCAGLLACPTPAPPAPPRQRVWPLPPEQPRYRYEATLRNAASLGPPSQAGSWQAVLGGGDLSRASFAKALGVAAHAGRVYVADTEGRRIFVFDLPRRRAFVFGVRREGELKKPVGIAVDAQGRVYVVDATARRVVVYDALGLYLRDFAGDAWSRPSAVAVSPQGDRIYVGDAGGVASQRHRADVHAADEVVQEAAAMILSSSRIVLEFTPETIFLILPLPAVVSRTLATPLLCRCCDKPFSSRQTPELSITSALLIPYWV